MLLTKIDIGIAEQQVLGPSRDYNQITILIRAVKSRQNIRTELLLTLCKIFCRLTLDRRLSCSKNSSPNEKTVASWLSVRCDEFTGILRSSIASIDIEEAKLALDLSYQLSRAEFELGSNTVRQRFVINGSLRRLFLSLLNDAEDSVLNYFITEYLKKHPDISRNFLLTMGMAFENGAGLEKNVALDRLISILLVLSRESPLSEEIQIPSSFTGHDGLHTKSSYKFSLGGMWLTLLRTDLTRSQRRRVLESFQSIIMPTISKPEAILDFLSDCCNEGGSEALLALSGLKTLIQERGLDYPYVFTRLYQVLDSEMMHRKYRSDTLRLLDSFLSSTHLPAAMIASFVKRSARLCLYSPPASVVAIVPFIYNLIYSHQACSLMLHRPRNEAPSGLKANILLNDPFNPEEPDPNLTRAVESSLWELDTLATHWHPNVAFISKLVAEQFLRQSYNLEHFLDHSYSSIFSAEAKKRVLKDPAVEYHIPAAMFQSAELDVSTTSRTIKWTFGKRNEQTLNA